jgi:hypothetical protein
MNERTTVRLPAELLDRARRKAAADGRTLTALIEDGLRLVVAATRKSSKGKRAVPRVSAAAGGLMPGVELTNSSVLQEAEDLEYVARIKKFR